MRFGFWEFCPGVVDFDLLIASRSFLLPAIRPSGIEKSWLLNMKGVVDMKKVVANVVVVVVASLYLVAKSLVIAARLINKELEPYMKPVSLLQLLDSVYWVC